MCLSGPARWGRLAYISRLIKSLAIFSDGIACGHGSKVSHWTALSEESFDLAQASDVNSNLLEFIGDLFFKACKRLDGSLLQVVADRADFCVSVWFRATCGVSLPVFVKLFQTGKRCQTNPYIGQHSTDAPAAVCGIGFEGLRQAGLYHSYDSFHTAVSCVAIQLFLLM
jgi:hypothetical protein